MRPLEASRPAGFSTVASDDDTLLRKWAGFQPMSCAFLIACTADFGTVTLKNTLAPLLLRGTMCVSMGGRVNSCVFSMSIIYFGASLMRPCCPLRQHLP